MTPEVKLQTEHIRNLVDEQRARGSFSRYFFYKLDNKR